jgi:5'(3')-deoxyribonucleotidase
MVKKENKTIKMFTATEEELIEKIVKEDHVFRKLNKIIGFEELFTPLRKLYSTTGAEGIDVIIRNESSFNPILGGLFRQGNGKSFARECSY